MKDIEKAESTASPPTNRGRDHPKESVLRDVLFLLLKIGAIAVVVMVLFTFVYGLHRAEDVSMKPAVRDGDLAMYYRLDKTYAAGDVLLLEFDGKVQIRRVVATAGDTVDIVEDALMINGALQQEPDIHEATQRYENGVSFPLTVGEDEVFVLADARENGTDSRVYGVVDTKDTLGKVISILRRRNI